MTDHFHIFELDAKCFKFWHNNGGDVLNATSSHDFDFSVRFQRVASDRNGDFNGYHGEGGAGVQSQFQGKFHTAARKLGMTGDDTFCRVKLESSHSLKSRCEAFRKEIGRIFDQNFFSFRMFGENLINIFSAWTMGYQPSGHGSGCSFVRFIDGDEKPFAVKSFFDVFDFLVFHDLPQSDEKYNTTVLSGQMRDQGHVH